MSDALETAMLVCFGLSWPLNVYKNIRAKSTRDMSLGFTLLIIAGYIAGISDRIILGSFNYVFVVYVVNIAVVSVNVIVYFVNKRYDCASDAGRRMRDAK